MSGGKHSGGTIPRYYDDPETAKLFEPVRTWLNKHHKKVLGDNPTGKQLAQLTSSLIQFQEDYLGLSAQHDRLLVRLPAKFFRDYAPGGALCVILATCYQYKTENDLRRWDFAAPGKVDRNMELFLQLEKRLSDEGLLKRPRIFFADTLDKSSLKSFSAIANKFQATIVHAAAEATHVVHPPIPADPLEKDNEWFRSSGLFGDLSFVHWWYFPDSYDSLLPVSEVDVDNEPAEQKAVWEVQGRWLLDLQKFNEYMNEEDYEVEDSQKILTSKPDQRSRKKSQNNSSSKSKGKEIKEPAPEEVTPQREIKRGKKEKEVAPPSPVAEPEPAPSKRKSGGKPSAKAMREIMQKEEEQEEEKEAESPEPLTTRKSRGGKKVPEEDSQKDKDTSSQPADEEAPSRKKRKRTPSPEPVASSHVVKRDKPEHIPYTLPKLPAPPPVPKIKELANSSSTNRQNMGSLIDISECDGAAMFPTSLESRVDETDDAKIVEEQQFHVIIPSYATWFDSRAIHELESRSLPEFFTEANKSAKGPELYIAYRNFMVDTYRLNPNEYLTVTSVRRNLRGDVGAIIRVHAFLEQWGLVNYQVRSENRPGPMGPPSTVHFNIIAETPKGFVPYLPPPAEKLVEHIVKLPKPQVPTVGEFGLKSDMFAKQHEPLPDEKPWTDEEILRLLEGIEMYKDDWKKVAEHVNFSLYQGNPVRSLDDCVTAFIRLPIEDPYLKAEPPLDFRKASDTGKTTGNPLLAAITFLATTIDSSIAVDGVKAALTSLCKTPQSRAEQTSAIEGQDQGQDQAQSTPGETQQDAASSFSDRIRQATAAALDVAKEKTKILAGEEVMKIKSLTAHLIELQLQKIELKLRQIDEYNLQVVRDFSAIEAQRKHLLLERQQFLQTKLETEKAYGIVQPSFL